MESIPCTGQRTTTGRDKNEDVRVEISQLIQKCQVYAKHSDRRSEMLPNSQQFNTSKSFCTFHPFMATMWKIFKPLHVSDRLIPF